MKRTTRQMLACYLCVAAMAAGAQVPPYITYQGRLLDTDGNPISGNREMQVSLYTNRTGGVSVYSESLGTVAVRNSVYSFQFGSDEDDFDQALQHREVWIEIRVGVDPPLAPRQRLVSVPYALRSAGATLGGYAEKGGFSPGPSATGSDSIAQGKGATASGVTSVVGGGDENTASATDATVGGGWLNTASGRGSVVSGGQYNRAGDQYATVGGGWSNTAAGAHATIGGGYRNSAEGDHATVAGGSQNTALGYGSTVPGGGGNTATGRYSFAAGWFAEAVHDGSFVWADYGTGSGTEFSSSAPDEFCVRAGGGTYFKTSVLDVDQGNILIHGPEGFDAAGEQGGVFFGDTNNYIVGEHHFGVKIGTFMAGDVIAIREITGNVGIGNNTPEAKLDVGGKARAHCVEIVGGCDVAEPFVVSRGQTAPPGALLVIDEENPGQLKISETAYDRCVAGVVSGAGGLRPGLSLSQEGVADDGVPVALSGRVYALASASNGPIRPGDLLTTGDVPGHAIKVTDHARAHGAVIGKAMSSLEQGQGLILVLVNLH